MAAATDEALFVPVIHNADELTIKGLAKKTNELAGKVRSGKLSGDDMKNGTFTINNTVHLDRYYPNQLLMRHRQPFCQ